ncbi:MAG: UbiA family prenyltransferase [Phycisphaeraceae bacterium]|nr:UbiA family prenyltransferase [Phycisphaeraceae bacterium]
MTTTTTHHDDEGASAARQRPLWRSLLKLARPKQWAKSVFVLIGPFYGLRDLAAQGYSLRDIAIPAFTAAVLFALASSACYVVNDIADRDADRLHPRKRSRPIASGAVRVPVARVFAACLLVLAFGGLVLLPSPARPWVALFLTLYVGNVFAYSARMKHIVIADVMSLAMGFVLRVMGGCAAVGIAPSIWLLNVTLFLAMFLAFGKRLGERRTLASSRGASPIISGDASAHRPVQSVYTDDLLRMMVVVTGVATLMGYAAYAQAKEADHHGQFPWLWITMLPATYCLLRCIVLLERGEHDDPTELATKDLPFQVSAGAFAVITASWFWFLGNDPGAAAALLTR